jgi:hypothetical protein
VKYNETAHNQTVGSCLLFHHELWLIISAKAAVEII